VALFRRRVPLAQAAKAVREELAELSHGPLPRQLEDLLEVLREHDPRTGQEVQEFVDALPEPAGVLGRDGRLSSTNARLDLLLGPGRTLGRTLLEATRSAELSEAAARAREGSASTAELSLPALGKLVLATAAPLSRRRALLVLRDLTEAKRLETMRRDFIANASHELRTPVAAIAGAVETLQAGGQALDEASRQFVEMIARHTERLSRLTRDLLDLSRLEAGDFRPALSPQDVEPLAEAALEAVRSRAKEKNIGLAVDVPPGLRVLADRRALEQVLVNLLENAVKYTPAGGRVTVLADEAASQVILSVIDTGPGIEARHRDRIFERFYRADPGRAREAGGSGLGLAIAKHLVQAQGGEIGVESGPGGSRFWVKLKVC
jgi:two-component system, OmpR family, phosphate regulon sensor histidine kinase PhoR